MTNEFLRHTLATINYRFQKSVRDHKDGFGSFSLGKGSRSPEEIVNHMFSVLNATWFFIENERHRKNKPDQLSLKEEIDRFNLELKKVDQALVEKELSISYSKRLLQGPLSDILTHIGQIAMLQRLYDNPIKGEDFSAADIPTGIE